MIQEIKYLQNHIHRLDITIDKLAKITRQVESMREDLKAELAGLYATDISADEPPLKSQVVNEVRAELVSKGINPDGPYRDYATRNYGLA